LRGDAVVLALWLVTFALRLFEVSVVRGVGMSVLARVEMFDPVKVELSRAVPVEVELSRAVPVEVEVSVPV